MNNLYVGIMSGTSLDAIDAVLVDFTDGMQLIATHRVAMPHDLVTQLPVLFASDNDEINHFMQLDKQLATLYSDATTALLKKSHVDATDVTAIGCHGQTIRHAPDATFPFTLQIGDPNVIAAQTGITTVSDFRRRDMALGGQGAPFAPAFHFAWLKQLDEAIVLNIGGIANVSIIDRNAKKQITGFDTGPGNTLMDAWCRRNRNKPYDDSGQWARSGTVNELLLQALLQDDYFSKEAPKSTGREKFNCAWLRQQLNLHNLKIPAEDSQATLLELTAQSISQAILANSEANQSVIICGGGAHNDFLMGRLQDLLSTYQVQTSEEFGIAPDWVEAVAFAWLAKQRIECVSVDMTHITGAKEPAVLGGVWLGSNSKSQ